MTTLSQSNLGPDDLCLVCNTTRENHGDKNHVFNMVDDQLIPIKPGPAARQQPPALRSETRAIAGDPATQVMLRLVERLIAANVLKGDDLLYIFGGGNAPDRRTTEN